MDWFKQKKAEPDLPSYVLLETNIPGEQGSKLLGRIVEDYRNPTDGYRPEDPQPALAKGPGVLQIIDTEFESLLSVEKNKTAQAKVGQILKIDFEKLKSEEHSLKSAFVRTRSLPQHFDAFKALLKIHANDIMQLMQRKDGKAYMVVAYKSCVNGQAGQERQYSKQQQVKIDVPVDTIASAASHGTFNLGDKANLSLQLGKKEGEKASTSATGVGEQIFAVRYRTLALRRRQQELGEPQFGDVLRVSYANGVFGYEDGPFITEDDASDDGDDTKASAADGEETEADIADDEAVVLGQTVEVVADDDDTASMIYSDSL